jgi:adenylate kinase
VVFDGFPRTLAQADALAEMLAAEGMRLDHVIEMRVADDEALVARVSGRSTCAHCGEVYHDQTKPIPADGHCIRCGHTAFTRRPDDNTESMRTRLLTYYKETAPLVGYYHAKGLLRHVDGLGEMDAVSRAVAAVLAAPAAQGRLRQEA